MDQQQYDIACQIVDQDYTLTSRLKDGKGNFCVIGGLYAAINPDWAESYKIHQWAHDIFVTVADTFGIDVDPIINANDNTKRGDPSNNIGPRRKRVKAALLAQLEG